MCFKMTSIFTRIYSLRIISYYKFLIGLCNYIPKFFRNRVGVIDVGVVYINPMFMFRRCQPGFAIATFILVATWPISFSANHFAFTEKISIEYDHGTAPLAAYHIQLLDHNRRSFQITRVVSYEEKRPDIELSKCNFLDLLFISVLCEKEVSLLLFIPFIESVDQSWLCFSFHFTMLSILLLNSFVTRRDLHLFFRLLLQIQ